MVDVPTLSIIPSVLRCCGVVTQGLVAGMNANRLYQSILYPRCSSSFAGEYSRVWFLQEFQIGDDWRLRLSNKTNEMRVPFASKRAPIESFSLVSTSVSPLTRPTAAELCCEQQFVSENSPCCIRLTNNKCENGRKKATDVVVSCAPY